MTSYPKGFTAKCGLSLLFFFLLTRLASQDRLAYLPPAITAEQRIAALEPVSPAAILDIPYVPGGGHKQQLDLYLPDTTGFSTVLFIHGGSLTGGDRRDEPHADICGTLQSLGIACAAMSYRLAPEHRWPAQPDDVVAAFAWVRENIAEHGGDPGAIYLFGHSSGCALAAIVAADASYLAKRGYHQRDIKGVIALGCLLDNTREVSDTRPTDYETYVIPPQRVTAFLEQEVVFTSIEQLNDAVPANHVDADLPPTLVLVAEGERFFPPVLRDGAEFVGRALVAGARADLQILADRTHMSALRRMITPTDPAIRELVRFIRGE